MPDHDAPASTSWLNSFLTAAKAFSVVLGVAGLGLFGGIGYGAWVASRGKQDDLFWLA